MQETQVQSLSREDPLEKGMATSSNILAWRIPWTWNSVAGWNLQCHKESDTAERLKPPPPSTWEEVFEKFYSNMIFTTIGVVICLLNLTILHLGLYFVCLFSHFIFTSILLCKGMEVKDKTGQAPEFEECCPRALGKCFDFCYKEETCSGKW